MKTKICLVVAMLLAFVVSAELRPLILCPKCKGVEHKVIEPLRIHSSWLMPDMTNYMSQGTIVLQCRTGRCTNIYRCEQQVKVEPRTILPTVTIKKGDKIPVSAKTTPVKSPKA